MNQRQEKIIALLQEYGDWVKGKDIAMVMHVSPRTIRSDIEAINAQLEKGQIESSSQQGYHLLMEDQYRSLTHSAIPQTPSERRSFILRQLIRKGKISLSTLPELVYASESTIENDLRIIRQRLQKTGSLVLSVRHNWIRLEGDERAKRHLYKELLKKEIEDNFMNLDRINGLFPDFDMAEIRDILEQCVAEYHLHIRDTAHPMMLIHIGIALIRLLNFSPLEENPHLFWLLDTSEYQAATRFCRRMEHRFPVHFPQAEVLQIALLLAGKASTTDFSAHPPVLAGRNVDLDDLMENMIQEIEQYYHVQIQRDTQALQGLRLHLYSLVIRLERNTWIDNPYLNELRWRFPLIFDMGVMAAGLFEREYGLRLQASEIGFLALHLGSACVMSRPPVRYRTIVLFPRDQAMSTFIVDRIAQRFADRLEIVQTLNVYEKKQVVDLHPDLILTLLPLEHDLNIPTLLLSLLSPQENEAHIFQALNKLDRHKGRLRFSSQVQGLLQPEFFYPELDASTPQELLEILCSSLREEEWIPDTFYDALLKREASSPSSFGAGFALPHPLKACASRSLIVVAFLKHPLLWGEETVDLVLLPVLRPEDRDLLGVFLEWWIELVSNPLHYGHLKTHRDYASFVQALLDEHH